MGKMKKWWNEHKEDVLAMGMYVFGYAVGAAAVFAVTHKYYKLGRIVDPVCRNTMPAWHGAKQYRYVVPDATEKTVKQFTEGLIQTVNTYPEFADDTICGAIVFTK
jgi:hypothetical protein